MTIPANHSLAQFIQGIPNEWLEEDVVTLLEALGVDTLAPPAVVVWAILLVRMAEERRVEFRAPLVCEELGIGRMEAPCGRMLLPHQALSDWIVYIRRELEIFTCVLKERGPKVKAPGPKVKRGNEWVLLTREAFVHVLEEE